MFDYSNSNTVSGEQAVYVTVECSSVVNVFYNTEPLWQVILSDHRPRQSTAAVQPGCFIETAIVSLCSTVVIQAGHAG